jgi:hypothetical protein
MGGCAAMNIVGSSSVHTILKFPFIVKILEEGLFKHTLPHVIANNILPIHGGIVFYKFKTLRKTEKKQDNPYFYEGV